jgi:hypothetical protein
MQLADIFADTSFTKYGPRKYLAEIDGRRIGVLLATKNSGFDTFALNKAEFDHLLAAKLAGRIDEAFVVAAKINGSTPPSYCGEIDAELLEGSLKRFTPRIGSLGDFYVLQDYNFALTDAPF